MKSIKEWEWDYRSLKLGHNWHFYNEDDTFEFTFDLLNIFIESGHVEITLFNFCICYQWDDKPIEIIETIKERNEKWKISQANYKKLRLQTWINEGIE